MKSLEKSMASKTRTKWTDVYWGYTLPSILARHAQLIADSSAVMFLRGGVRSSVRIENGVLVLPLLNALAAGPCQPMAKLTSTVT
jgi:hypothetical protein